MATRRRSQVKRCSFRYAAGGWLVSVVLCAGCGSGVKVTAPVAAAPTNSGPQNYFSGVVAGPTRGLTNFPGTYTIDDFTKTFAQLTYAFGANASIFGAPQNGPEVNYSGNYTSLARSLLELDTTYAETAAGPVDYTPALAGSWAVELAGQAGGLVALTGQPFTPLVAAQTCPQNKTAATFRFITIPAALTVDDAENQLQWNPQYDTAYGSVDVSANGAIVTFSQIEQFTVAGDQLRNYSTFNLSPAPVAYTSISGECSPTFYGDTISVPGTLTITNPGVGETIESAATLAIGPSGLLVEANGNGYSLPASVSAASVAPAFEPFLGAGTGAIGLPEPSSPLSVTDLTGAQYLGFFYGFDSNENSTVASFGFPSGAPASCAGVTTQTTTLIYGGDFANNDPSAAAVQAGGGFGSCDAAVDLGIEDPNNNGLFPNAVVTEGTNFASNSTGMPEVLPAVGIAGMLNGKFAIFLITSTGQGIYLLQSN